MACAKNGVGYLVLKVIAFQGYRKIPGDICQGGFEPTRKVVNLHKNCPGVSNLIK